MVGCFGILLGQKNRGHGGDCAWDRAWTKGGICLYSEDSNGGGWWFLM